MRRHCLSHQRAGPSGWPHAHSEDPSFDIHPLAVKGCRSYIPLTTHQTALLTTLRPDPPTTAISETP